MKLRLDPVLGLKRFRTVAMTMGGIEPLRRIQTGQFNLRSVRLKDRRAPTVCNAVLAA